MTVRNTSDRLGELTEIRARLCECPVEFLSPRRLMPARLNDRIYRPADPNDRATRDLAASVSEFGIWEPLVVTRDLVVLSGHRRLAAALVARLEEVPVRVAPIDSGSDLFPQLLVLFNQQRVKTRQEIIREQIVKTAKGINPHTVKPLDEYRARRSRVEAEAEDVPEPPKRYKISRQKAAMLDHALRVVNTNRRYWPLTDRQIHYRLLNHRFLRNVTRPDSWYVNDRNSYDDLTDLLLRARIEGRVPWHAIEDETRPIETWNRHRSIDTFIRQELDWLFDGYRRDLLQDQPCHLEVYGEKNTLRGTLDRVCGRYGVTFTIGRGYCSGPPRKKLKDRFRSSGKDRLVLVTLSDFDPEGIDIPLTVAQSLMRDFGLRRDQVTLIRAGLTRGQIDGFDLPLHLEAKEGSSRYKRFAAEHGTRACEIDALPPEELDAVLERRLLDLIDPRAYNRELREEDADIRTLQAVRSQLLEFVSGLDFDEIRDEVE